MDKHNQRNTLFRETYSRFRSESFGEVDYNDIEILYRWLNAMMVKPPKLYLVRVA